MKKRISLLLTLCMMLSLLTACAKNSTNPVVTDNPSTPVDSVVSTEPKPLNLPFNGEVTTTNPYIAAQESDTDMGSLLTARPYGYIPREDGNGSSLVPMLAQDEPIDVKGDGTVWRFTIREGAKWENGEPINADTFMYSWKMCLDPTLLVSKAGAFANTYVEILNAAAYFSQASTGVAVNWEDVGLKKIDDRTLEITLASDYSKVEVMRHFATQGCSPVYEPLFEAGMNSGRTETTYGSELSQIISCGSFSLTEWVKGSEYRFEKNENYVRADLIKLDGIAYRTIEDKGTQQQMFDAGELDSTLLDTAGIAKYSEDPRFTPAGSAYIRMMDICDTNPDRPILANENFKKALFYGIDRVTIAKLAGKMPATWVVPHTSVAYADGTAFRHLDIANEYLPENYGYDPDFAKECFDKALKEVGIDKVELSITYSSTSADHKVISEFLQEAWAELFGADRFKLNLNAMPNAQSLEVRKSSPANSTAYELGLGDWAQSAGTYNSTKHIETYTSMYTKKNAPYHNDQLDALYKESQLSENRKDERKRAELTAAMEKVIIEDIVTIPILENRTFYLFSDRIQLPLNDKDTELGWGFRFADIIQ
jgi:oligopeptide transport system substrate-binding protein